MVAKQIHTLRHKFVIVFMAIIMLSSVLAALAPTHTTYADPDPGTCQTDQEWDSDKNECVTKANADTPKATAKSDTCAVEKIGWFICPVVEQSAKISDKAFQVLADNFLRTDPELLSQSSGTKVAWEYARNIANILFIIAFVIIIIAQVTGFGISNYGIKKMLPRLVVAAVAVNVSYYICQLIVDLTNIMGYEIQHALVNISNDIGPSVFGAANQYGSTEHNTNVGTGLTVIAVGALAVTGVVFLIMGPLLSVIAMVLVTVLTIIIILLLRKALIVLLVVVSPIAFVLYLLPNTEKYFSKWLNMFIQLLMIFPVVGLLLGGGKLAGTIILVAGSYSTPEQVETAQSCNPDSLEDKKRVENKLREDKVQYSGCGYGATIYNSTADGDTSCGGNEGCSVTASWQLGLVATGVTVIPLFAVYSVLKGALSAAGAIGGKIQALGSRARTSAQKRVEASDKSRQDYMKLKYGQATGSPLGFRKQKREFKRQSRARELGRFQQERLAEEVLADNNLAKSAAGSIDPSAIGRVQANAQNLVIASQGEDVKNARSELNPFSHDTQHLADAFEKAIEHGDVAGAKAAQEMLFEAGESGADAFRQSILRMQNTGFGGATGIQTMDTLRQHMTSNQSQVKSVDAGAYAWASSGGSVSDTGRQLNNPQLFGGSAVASGLTDAQLATQTKASLNNLSSGISKEQVERVLNPNNATSSTVKGGQRAILEDIKNRQP